MVELKIVVIYGGIKEKREVQNNILSLLVKMVSDTLKELHIEVEEVLLDHYNIEYYYGKRNNNIKQITKKISEAEGVIFVSEVVLGAPTGIIKVFLEHLTHSAYKDILEGKYGFSICFTDTTGERESAEYILRAWEMLGGIEGGKVPFRMNSVNELETLREGIEKRVEGFYKIFRQPGYKLPNSDNYLVPMMDNNKISNWNIPVVDKVSKEAIQKEPIEIKSDKFKHFSEEQEEDIKELTDYFKQQLSSNKNEKPINEYGIYTKPSPSVVVENKKTCKQMTKNLPHYFQPHLAVDFSSNFQFSITGKEQFNGYVVVDKGECTYFDGENEHADIHMIMNDDIWVDILKGNISAQKAFMTGQLKVRGNFMLLNKLDQLFKKMS